MAFCCMIFDIEREGIWDEETDTYTHILKVKGSRADWILTRLIGWAIEKTTEQLQIEGKNASK